VKTRVHQLLRLLHIRQRSHPRAAGEHAAYYFDPAELGVTTTSATDESW
jgi:hypothetical protein